MFTTIRRNITIPFTYVDLTGDIEYDADRGALVLVDPLEAMEEHLSTSLEAYGLQPGEGCVFVKDWTEHAGLAGALERAGVVEILGKVEVPTFALDAYRVRVLA